MKPFLKQIMKEIWVARGKEKKVKRKSLEFPIERTPTMLNIARWLGS